jgi:hypothetical protein
VKRLHALPALLAAALCACGGDEKPEDDDFERHLAKPLPMNKVFTDSLSANGGDLSDWKIFNAISPASSPSRCTSTNPTPIARPTSPTSTARRSSARRNRRARTSA